MNQNSRKQIEALLAASKQLAAVLELILSHASDEIIESYRHTVALCHAALSEYAFRTPIPSSDDARKRMRPGLWPAGSLPPCIKGGMVLIDPETRIRWEVQHCRFAKENEVADLRLHGAMTAPCDVLRTWSLGEDWDEGAAPQ